MSIFNNFKQAFVGAIFNREWHQIIQMHGPFVGAITNRECPPRAQFAISDRSHPLPTTGDIH